MERWDLLGEEAWCGGGLGRGQKGSIQSFPLCWAPQPPSSQLFVDPPLLLFPFLSPHFEIQTF